MDFARYLYHWYDGVGNVVLALDAGADRRRYVQIPVSAWYGLLRSQQRPASVEASRAVAFGPHQMK